MKARIVLITLITASMTTSLWAFDKMKLTESHEKGQVQTESAPERAPSSTGSEAEVTPEPEKKMFKEHFFSRPEIDR